MFPSLVSTLAVVAITTTAVSAAAINTTATTLPSTIDALRPETTASSRERFKVANRVRDDYDPTATYDSWHPKISIHVDEYIKHIHVWDHCPLNDQEQTLNTSLQACGYPDWHAALANAYAIKQCVYHESHISGIPIPRLGDRSTCMYRALEYISGVCREKYGTNVIHRGLWLCKYFGDGTSSVAVDCFTKSLELNGGQEKYGGEQCLATAILRHRAEWGINGDTPIDMVDWKIPEEYEYLVPKEV